MFRACAYDGHCLKGAEHWFAFAHPLIRLIRKALVWFGLPSGGSGHLRAAGAPYLQ